MQKMEMKSGTILYRSRGGSILWTVLYLIDALVCIFLACIVFMVMEEYELLLVLRYGRGVYIIPWILLIAGAVSMVGFVNLLLSKIIIFSDHVEGTPFSWFRRTTMYVERNQIQSVEIDTKRSWLIIHTTAGKYKNALQRCQNGLSIVNRKSRQLSTSCSTREFSSTEYQCSKFWKFKKGMPKLYARGS